MNMDDRNMTVVISFNKCYCNHELFSQLDNTVSLIVTIELPSVEFIAFR